MTGENHQELKPKLRFPKFDDESSWDAGTLGEYCERLTATVGDRHLTPVSITAGKGFVSHSEKFGRDISGAQYSKYIRLRRGDFAYNRGNSKRFPQGSVYQLTEFAEAAASNAFYCFRLHDGYEPGFFNGLFEKNTHGRQLLKDITSGARSTGLLNISADAFFGITIPMPKTAAEQKMIAECLDSLDTVIAGHGRKLEALRRHKQGLWQQLFPQEGETRPRLRFPEFRNMPEWRVAPIGDLFETKSGGTPDRSRAEFWNDEVPWVTTSIVDFSVIESTKESISRAGLSNSSAKVFPKQTVLMAMYGQGKTRGKVALLGIEAATNQACAAILPSDDIEPRFVFLNLAGRYEEIRAISNSGGQKNLSQALVRNLSFAYPEEYEEQQKLASCLSALDDQITAQARKIDALKQHKQGLMQQLFPSPDAVEP